MTSYKGLTSFLHDFAGLVFPDYCAACGCALFRNEETLCLKCYAGLPRTGFHRYPENEVAQMFWGRVPVSHATAFMYFIKGSHYRHILHEIKYKGRNEVGIAMGRIFGIELMNTPFSEADMIHPVPLHPAKLRRRGYNQSEMIARGMAEILQIPVETSLISRKTDTPTQTHKSRYDRWENVSRIFSCDNPESLSHKHILLVDDVITTGATFEAIVSCILRAEGITISLASLAFTKLQ